MLRISKEDIISRLKLDNPWWTSPEDVSERLLPKRDYFSKFYKLVTDWDIRRATIMMGPRRVGKTIIIRQTILDIIDNNAASPQNTLCITSAQVGQMAGYC